LPAYYSALDSSLITTSCDQRNDLEKTPLALVKLLKVLDRHPDLLNEMRAE
jgi:hypothetical protein